MSDKDVERNVRSTTIEGIQTPTQRHVQGIGEKHAVTFSEKSEARKAREGLLQRFKRREAKGKSAAEGHAGEERSEPVDGGGGTPPE